MPDNGLKLIKKASPNMEMGEVTQTAVAPDTVGRTQDSTKTYQPFLQGNKQYSTQVQRGNYGPAMLGWLDAVAVNNPYSKKFITDKNIKGRINDLQKTIPSDVRGTPEEIKFYFKNIPELTNDAGFKGRLSELGAYFQKRGLQVPNLEQSQVIAVKEKGGKISLSKKKDWITSKSDGGISKNEDGGNVSEMKKGGDHWIQKATKNMRTDKPCTGDKFGSESCPSGSKRYNLAKTFRKMNKK